MQRINTLDIDSITHKILNNPPPKTELEDYKSKPREKLNEEDSRVEPLSKLEINIIMVI